MLNVAEIIDDPDFAQSFTILRATGAYVAGVWTQTPLPVALSGVISVANGDDLLQIPEGDRVGGMMVIHTTSPIYQTSAARGETSDLILWRGDQYRVSNVLIYADYGYWKAFAVRTTGN